MCFDLFLVWHCAEVLFHTEKPNYVHYEMEMVQFPVLKLTKLRYVQNWYIWLPKLSHTESCHAIIDKVRVMKHLRNVRTVNLTQYIQGQSY